VGIDHCNGDVPPVGKPATTVTKVTNDAEGTARIEEARAALKRAKAQGMDLKDVREKLIQRLIDLGVPPNAARSALGR
jgi:hypothetical protein